MISNSVVMAARGLGEWKPSDPRVIANQSAVDRVEEHGIQSGGVCRHLACVISNGNLVDQLRSPS